MKFLIPDASNPSLFIDLLFSTLCPSSFAIILWGRESWLFALIVVFMPCVSKCSLALPRGAVCWSAVRDCGIS